MCKYKNYFYKTARKTVKKFARNEIPFQNETKERGCKESL